MARIQFAGAAPDSSLSSRVGPLKVRPYTRLDTVLNATLPCTSPGTLWDISILGGRIKSATAHDPSTLQAQIENVATTIDAHGALVGPALCHPHIHLDKPYLLSHPKYSHLQIQRGDFAEAMELTNKAKKNFAHDDLCERGQRVVDESVIAGVTSMRAFVEVDPIVGMTCLDAGKELKDKARDRCEIQLCAFAQLPLFSGHEDSGEEMRSLVESAAQRPETHVVGSTPYVEGDRDAMKRNVAWLVDLALTTQKHIDFHLDYNLDADTEPLIWFVIETLKFKAWTSKTNKTIVLGHCTRLCLFTDAEWQRLKHEIADLPISFVGLPTSDLFMMRTENQVRGTLPIPRMIKELGLNAAVGINNVGNAFTPQGCCDPLSVASMCVGVYQAGTVSDAEMLYECISTRARAAIGLVDTSSYEATELDTKEAHSKLPLHLNIAHGDKADLVVFAEEEVEWRTRRSISEAVYLHDGARGRRTIKGGVLVE
ncbi:hypothetical protein AAFC00_004313 [Neodothiora populina]